MLVALIGLTILLGWTMSLSAALIFVRLKHLAAGGAVQDFATPNEQNLLWRLYRTHANLTENLPLYLGVIFLLMMQQATGTMISGRAQLIVDCFILIYVVARLGHSIIHIAGRDPAFRIVCLAIQYICLAALMAIAFL